MPEIDDLLATTAAPTAEHNYRLDRSTGAEFSTAFITILVAALFLILAVLIGPLEDHAEPLEIPSEPDAALTAAPTVMAGTVVP